MAGEEQPACRRTAHRLPVRGCGGSAGFRHLRLVAGSLRRPRQTPKVPVQVLRPAGWDGAGGCGSGALMRLHRADRGHARAQTGRESSRSLHRCCHHGSGLHRCDVR